MKINVSNTVKITAALSASEGRVRARTVDADDVLALVENAERHLASLGLPKNRRAGATVCYWSAGLPNAYKYRAGTTRVDLVRGPSGWFLTGVSRITIFPGEKSVRRVNLTDDQVSYLADALRNGQDI